MRRIPPDKAAEIVRLRALNMPIEAIAKRLGLQRSTVYNYLGKLQPFEDEAFLEEFQSWLEIFHKLHSDGNEHYIPLSDQARRLGGILRKSWLTPEFISQAVLNAHWARVQACRKRKPST